MKKSILTAGFFAVGTFSILSAAPAHAAISGCTGGSSGNQFLWGDIKNNATFTCVVDDKTYSDFSYSSVGGSGISDTDQFSISAIGAGGLTHNFNVQSGGSFLGSTVSLSYKVTRTSGNNTFDKYSGNITGDNATQWSLSIGATNAPTSPSNTLNYPTLGQAATTPDVSFTNGATSSVFSNTLTANGSGAGVTQFSNRLTQAQPPTGTPGPLPLLGAGAAFGFSRKLRSRVKATV